MIASSTDNYQAPRAGLVLLLAVHLLASIAYAANEEPIKLFEIEEASQFSDAKLLVGAKRHGIIQLKSESLDRLRQQVTAQADQLIPTPFEVSMSLSKGKEYLVKVNGVNPLKGDRFTLSGRLDGDPFGMVILAYYEGIISASISGSQGENYLIEKVQDNFYLVSEPLPGNRFKCGVDSDFMALQRKINQGQATAGTPGRKIQKQSGQPGGNEPGGYQLLGGSPATASNPVTVDIMVVYTQKAKEHFGDSNKEIKNRIDLCIATANEIFENSKVYVKCNLVHTEEVDYDHASRLKYDLNNLSGIGSGNLHKDIKKLRTKYGADLVSLFVKNEDEPEADKPAAGIAWRPKKLPFSPSDGFSANQVIYSGLEYTFTHEIGHNFGCDHDRLGVTDDKLANSRKLDAFGGYSYGYIFQANDTWYRTVMSYWTDRKETRIRYFSNPHVKYQGEAIGTKETHNEPCYNAKTINETAWSVANYRHRIDKPYIIKHPIKYLLLNEGDSHTLKVNAGGKHLEYEWLKNDNPFNWHNPSYEIRNAQKSHKGRYRVIVSNPGGSVESKGTYLDFNEPPIIDRHIPAQNFDFIPSIEKLVSVTCFDREGEIKSIKIDDRIYTSKDESMWKDQGGIITATIEKKMPKADTVEIKVVVSDAQGGITEVSIKGKIPDNKPLIIVHQPRDLQINKGETANFSVEVYGEGPFTYRWKRKGTFISPIQHNPELTIPNAGTVDEGAYKVVVKNAKGSEESEVAYLYFNLPPKILYQPEAQAIPKGKPASFRIIVSGTQPLTYSWKKNGRKIPGAKASTYLIPEVYTRHNGIYQLQVRNIAGEVESLPMELSVILPPAILIHPGDQIVDYGKNIKLSVKASGTEPLSYLWQRDDQFVGFQRTLSLPEIEMNQAGPYRVIVRNAAGETASNIASIIVRPPDAVPVIRVQPRPRVVSSGDSVTFAVQAEGTAPLIYRWKKDDTFITSDREESFLVLETVKRENAGNYTVRIRNKVGLTWSEAALLVVDPETPHIVAQPVAQSIVEGGAFVMSVQAIGRGELSYQWKKDGKKIPGALGQVYSISNSQFGDEGEYQVLVRNDYGVTKSQTTYIEIRDPKAARITQQPYSEIVTVGDPVEFSVKSSGTEPFTYQWSLNGTILPQAKTATYRIAKAGFQDEGDYQVLVQNAYGRDSSGTFTLQVYPRIFSPTIITQPEDHSIKKGETATLAVEVTGEKPFTYQWKKDRVPIPDSNNPVYSIEKAQPEDTGIYRVEVTNKYGYVISKPVRLDVIDLGTAKVTSITINGLDSSSMAVWLGEPVELKINATGRNPITYWWEFNDEYKGDTGQTYKVNSFKPGDAGKYTGRVRNEEGEDSSFIMLTLRNPGFSSVSLNPDNTMTLTIDAPIGRLVILERSGDLVAWEEAERFDHDGSPLSIPSSTSDKLFYRLKIE